MKGHIAFCPHFHQPHFQLYKTREEAYQNSYAPWVELMKKSVQMEGFFINLHFSGPFLYWMRAEKPWFLENMRGLLESKKIGIIGGLADEPFIQLSSRPDDVLFQIKEYDALCSELFAVNASDWQGIHLVERECGEHLLQEVSRAAKIMGAPPIYYLDAETFYESYFSGPGGPADYCLKHFGFTDPFSKTTIAHFPQEMLYFALRDEIGGQPFYSVPVHTQHRYQLLKTNGFTSQDRTRIKPRQYVFDIKDVMEKACELSRRWGREIEPIVVIFEDAEKFGQWSKNPEDDTRWMLEFFELVEKDDELSFTGLKEYIQQHGIFDTYPVASSHSYPEWENWTAKRGIRGVTFGDERLRRVMTRIRGMENKQATFEEKVLQKLEPEMLSGPKGSMMKRAILQSAERHEIIANLLEENAGSESRQDYQLINRIRNLLYQEDPKWASRHPCYGSSPYYDMQGLAYLEISERVLDNLAESILQQDATPWNIVRGDVSHDGCEEVLVQNPWQTLLLNTEGGCLDYHHVLSPEAALQQDFRQGLLEDMKRVNAYNSIYQHSCPLVLSETDSSMLCEIYPEGGRREYCRNSLRCDLYVEENESFVKVGQLDKARFEISSVETMGDMTKVLMKTSHGFILPNGQKDTVILVKEFRICEDQVEVSMQAHLAQGVSTELFLVPQIVTNAAPSDEVNFKPCSFIDFRQGTIPLEFLVEDIMEKGNDDACSYQEQRGEFPYSGQIDYGFQIYSGNGESFLNLVNYGLKAPEKIRSMVIKPAVQHYYQGLVFPDQSRLGYNSSGIMIQPFIPFVDQLADFEVSIKVQLNQSVEHEVENIVQLIRR